MQKEKMKSARYYIGSICVIIGVYSAFYGLLSFDQNARASRRGLGGFGSNSPAPVTTVTHYDTENKILTSIGFAKVTLGIMIIHYRHKRDD